VPSIVLIGSNRFSEAEKEIPKLQNPVSVSWLKENLHKSLPRLVLNPCSMVKNVVGFKR
jgi:hypothetical protein